MDDSVVQRYLLALTKVRRRVKLLCTFCLPVFFIVWEVELLLFVWCDGSLAARSSAAQLLQLLVLVLKYGWKRSLVHRCLLRPLVPTTVRTTHWSKDGSLGWSINVFNRRKTGMTLVAFFFSRLASGILLWDVLNIVFTKIVRILIQSHLRKLTKCLGRTDWVILTPTRLKRRVHRHLGILTYALGWFRIQAAVFTLVAYVRLVH